MTENEFKRMRKSERIKVLKRSAQYIGNRLTTGHTVHLYYLKPHYVEIWIIKGINQIHWVEIQKNQDIINDYAERVDLDDLFK